MTSRASGAAPSRVAVASDARRAAIAWSRAPLVASRASASRQCAYAPTYGRPSRSQAATHASHAAASGLRCRRRASASDEQDPGLGLRPENGPDGHDLRVARLDRRDGSSPRRRRRLPPRHADLRARASSAGVSVRAHRDGIQLENLDVGREADLARSPRSVAPPPRQGDPARGQAERASTARVQRTGYRQRARRVERADGGARPPLKTSSAHRQASEYLLLEDLVDPERPYVLGSSDLALALVPTSEPEEVIGCRAQLVRSEEPHQTRSARSLRCRSRRLRAPPRAAPRCRGSIPSWRSRGRCRRRCRPPRRSRRPPPCRRVPRRPRRRLPGRDLGCSARGPRCHGRPGSSRARALRPASVRASSNRPLSERIWASPATARARAIDAGSAGISSIAV